MITFANPVTGQFDVEGTVVTTTFNGIEPCDTPGEYRLLWILDNDGQPQVTSNGTASLSPSQYEAILSSNQQNP